MKVTYFLSVYGTNMEGKFRRLKYGGHKQRKTPIRGIEQIVLYFVMLL
jgi:hypothetical protein